VIIAEDLVDPTEAVGLAERTCAALERPFFVSGEEVVCTASAGITTTRDPMHSADTLLQEADLALYRAKARGRNRAEVFDEQLRATAIGRLGIEQTIRAALDEDRIIVAYQPVIDLSTERLVGAEALVRIRTGDSMIFPDEFIGVAEETGLLVPIDARVLESAITRASSWIAAESFEGVSINVTARHLADPTFVEILTDAVVRRSLPPGALILEFNEQTLAEAPKSARRVLDEVRALGVTVGLDDFGTGLSSLSHLRQFPLDFVKLDRVLIKDVAVSGKTRRLLTAAVAFVHALELVVVAEGVETVEELEIVMAAGCDRAQGFFLGQAAEPERITELLCNQLRI
jgi:EAL domain-containing protein (putative c-di-GMP-specific phosphodiesterase class I)